MAAIIYLYLPTLLIPSNTTKPSPLSHHHRVTVITNKAAIALTSATGMRPRYQTGPKRQAPRQIRLGEDIFSTIPRESHHLSPPLGKRRTPITAFKQPAGSLSTDHLLYHS